MKCLLLDVTPFFCIPVEPPNTPKMVDVRKLWSITQSFWIHTGIYIYTYIYIYIKRLLEADLLYHIHILRSRSAPKKSGIHGCRQGVFISTHDLTTFLHLGRTRKVWMIAEMPMRDQTWDRTWDSKIRNGEPPRKLVNWIIIWHGWGLQSIFVQ